MTDEVKVFKDKKEHKISALNALNDSDMFLVITNESYAVNGSHENVVLALANAIMGNENIKTIIADAVSTVMHAKK